MGCKLLNMGPLVLPTFAASGAKQLWATCSMRPLMAICQVAHLVSNAFEPMIPLASLVTKPGNKQDIFVKA